MESAAFKRRVAISQKLRAKSSRALRAHFFVERCEAIVSGAPGPRRRCLWVGAGLRCRILTGRQTPPQRGLLIRERPNPEAAPSLVVLAALLSSRLVADSLARDASQLPTVEAMSELALPTRHPLFQTQLEALWHHATQNSSRSSGRICDSIRGSFDRIAAETYGLTLDELVEIDAIDSAYDKSDRPQIQIAENS
jgi:hypothetical protein